MKAEAKYASQPGSGCTSGCGIPRCGWVPYPRSNFPRRDPLIDAVSRTDNPCDRPARCQPCCKPTPKFRHLKEKPICDINCYRKEQAEAKIKDYYEQCQKYMERYCPCPPEMIIESLDPKNCPIGVEMPYDCPTEQNWFLKDFPCSTNIISGLFNPNDNKTPEQKLQEKCDPFYKNCGPCLPTYPCRGVISSPRQGWVSQAQEQRLCLPSSCEGSSFLKPEYMQEQQAIRDRLKMVKCMQEKQKQMEELRRTGYITPDPCCPEKFSQSPYCNNCM